MSGSVRMLDLLRPLIFNAGNPDPLACVRTKAGRFFNCCQPASLLGRYRLTIVLQAAARLGLPFLLVCVLLE